MGYLLVGIGGAFGSLVRYILGIIVTRKPKHTFPISTVIINVTGAMLLGLVSNIPISKTFLLLYADGFLGAYTTFSTFMFEGFSLFHEKKYLNAVIYITSSLLLGIVFYALGMLVARQIIR